MDEKSCAPWTGNCGLSKPCSYKCWNFTVSVLVSMVALAVSICGLSGVFGTENLQFYMNLIIFILGIWCPSPTIKKEPEKSATLDGERAI